MTIRQNPDKKFQTIFDKAPISLWIEDFSEVKKFVDQLRASGVDDLKAHCKSHPDIVHECVRKIRVIDVNKATLNLYKAKNKKALLSGVDKTFTEESFEIFGKELLALAEGKSSVSGEAVTKTLTGELVNIIVYVTIAPGYEDTWSHVLVAITDITERTQAEEKFRVLATKSLVGIYIIQDGVFKYVNSKLAEIFGYTEKEFIDRLGPKQLTFEEDWPTVSENLHRRMEGKEKSIHYTFRGITREGKIIEIEAFGSVTLYLGKPAVIGTLLDITDRKQAEKKLRDSEQQLSLIYDSVGDVLYYLSVEPGDCFRFLSVNQAFLDATGLAKAQIIGKPVEEVIPEPSISMVKDNYRKSIQEKRVVRWQETSEYPSGVRIGDVSIAPVFDDQGICTRLVGSVHDITERVQADMALEHSNRALKTLSACNQVLIHTEDEAQFLNDICHAIVEQGGYKLAWLGRAEHDRAKSVRPIAEAGFDEGYLESLNIIWADKKRGRGPMGIAIRTREPSIVQNIQVDPRFSPWRQAALKHGYQSSIALPIMVDDKMFGALSVYASEPYAFIEDEVNLLEELADDIGYGISMLRLRKERLQTEEALQKSERQYHEVIKTARDAFVSMDTEGNITDWNPQAEAIFGWKRAEILGQPVSETIVPPESRKKHKQGLKYYLANGGGFALNQTVEITAQHQDGHTFPVELSIVPMQTNGTKRFNAFIRDITERHEAQQNLKASLVGSIVAISRAVEARDPYTAGHQQRVSQLARCIAQEMGLDSDRIDGLRMGATIHDIGKIHLPAEILSKPTKLTKTEFELIKTHCQIGYDILKDISFPWPVADIAWQHHERLDGTGYPQGLKDEEICLEARIVAVADAVEAISSHRPYRPALGINVALEEIEAKRGKWYDATVVDVCLKLFNEEGFSFK